ncbi:FeoA family protein [Deinococcus peraridilitoris]|uniref:FeoA family protein n=1 Tax=Deinococcus peraridilitoris TaxID=432329 RepID=UPI0006932D2B|nr:FeoA domain-containing protein [Deinococcus peraridilitoris]
MKARKLHWKCCATTACFEARIAQWLGHPAIDPHGDPIPGKDGELPSTASHSLSSLQVGESAHILRVPGEAAVLRSLMDGGLTPSVEVRLLSREEGLGIPAIGLVFPALFSLGILAVSMQFRNVHLDLDAVLYGKIAYTPFYDLTIGGVNLGATSL